MTKDLPHISTSQLFCILLLSRISAEIVYPQEMDVPFLDSLIAVLISEAVRFLIALPVILYSRKGSNIHYSSWKKSPAIGWIGAVAGALLLVGASVKTLIHAVNFADMLTEISGAAVMIAGAVFAIYCAYMGVEAFARSSAIFLVLAGIITVTVYLADIPFMEAVPLRKTDFGDLFSETVNRFFRGGDYLIFTALLPYVNKKQPGSAAKTVMIFAGVSTVISVGLSLCSGLVLRGVYAEYPFTAAASLSDIALFKRLDGVGAAVWSLCALTRSGIMLFSAYAMAKSILIAKPKAGEEA